MNDVLVSYQGGQFGDWLRYFIAQHDGFEKFKDVQTKPIPERNDPVFPNFSFSAAYFQNLVFLQHISKL